ncbi:thioesterase family protein [Rhodococcus aerolatus]
MTEQAPASPAFYLPLPPAADGAERFHATERTVGPWTAQMQHMSPPAALLARAVQRCSPRGGTRLARLTVEVLGPVPPGELTVRTEVLRPGKQIELVGARLLAAVPGGAERVVASASAWRLATVDTTAVAQDLGPVMPPVPGPSPWTRSPGWVAGYVDAIEWRWIDGDLAQPGPGRVWARPRVPLVAGEEPDVLQRFLAVVDSANGVGAPLSVGEWTFLNTDLTVHLHRDPVGEWVGIDASTSIGPDGIGSCTAVLHDERGPVGRSAQILLVRPR